MIKKERQNENERKVDIAVRSGQVRSGQVWSGHVGSDQFTSVQVDKIN